MTYVALILIVACVVLGFCLYVTLAGTSAQIRDLLEEREELLTEIRRLQRGNHPAGRALQWPRPAPLPPRVPPIITDPIALAEALTERDAEHDGGGGA